MAANDSEWIVDVWIIFILFKYLVFRSFMLDFFWKEAWKFISVRLLSGALDMLILWIFVELIHLDVMLAKGIDIVIIIVVNYVTAKLLVFRK